MMHYHNDNEKSCAKWLHHLMNEGFIEEGYIDDRSITEIKPEEIKDFTQCHFFAGIGGWSEALRLAGWDTNRPVWTASCPCQPFSVAGKGRGEGDERHLWPIVFDLIRECSPPIIFGEQVASNLGRDWLSSVFVDLETLGYRVAGADMCAASVGAPHIRQRLYWVAYSERRATERHGFQMAGEEGRSQEEIRQGPQRVWDDSGDGRNLNGKENGLAHTKICGDRRNIGEPQQTKREDVAKTRQEMRSTIERFGQGNEDRLANTDNNNGRANKARGLGRSQEKESPDNTGIRSTDDRLGNPERRERGIWQPQKSKREQIKIGGSSPGGGLDNPEHIGSYKKDRQDKTFQRKERNKIRISESSSSNDRLGNPISEGLEGHSRNEQRRGESGREQTQPNGSITEANWGNIRWVKCADGKERPIEPGILPLAHGIPGRVDAIKGYGNAIVPQVAATFIRSVMEIIDDRK